MRYCAVQIGIQVPKPGRSLLLPFSGLQSLKPGWNIDKIRLLGLRGTNYGVYKKLREELNDPYCSPNIFRVIKSRRMRWAGHVARMGKKRGVYRVLVGKPEGKKQLGRSKRRWEYNIAPLNAELYPICRLLALFGAHHILHVSR
jgi:hypothetical protein